MEMLEAKHLILFLQSLEYMSTRKPLRSGKEARTARKISLGEPLPLFLDFSQSFVRYPATNTAI